MSVYGSALPVAQKARPSRALLASDAGIYMPSYGLVGASKAALESVVRHLALELGPLGIRVNTIVPGLMDTDVLSLFNERDQIIAEAARRTPLGRIVSPTEVAAVASFIASPAASFIHGQTINVDGGYGIVG